MPTLAPAITLNNTLFAYLLPATGSSTTRTYHVERGGDSGRLVCRYGDTPGWFVAWGGVLRDGEGAPLYMSTPEEALQVLRDRLNP